MKVDLTDKELRYIFETAHREWLEDTSYSQHKDRPEKYVIAKCYFKASVSLLKQKGLIKDESE